MTRLPDMAYRRSFATSVVLPNGQVVVVGGQVHAAPFVDRTAVLQPELWTPVDAAGSPSSPAWPCRAPTTRLPSCCRTAGSSPAAAACAGTCLTNHPDGQIFTPPYLLRSDGSLRTRPTHRLGTGHGICGASTRLGAREHDRHLVRARAHRREHPHGRHRPAPDPAHAAVGTRRHVPARIPTDAGTVVPGDYLLFGFNDYGTPSVASWSTSPDPA